MPLDEIVIGEVKGNGCLKVFQLLAESIGKPSQTAHVKAGRAIQPLNVAGGGKVHIRGSSHAPLLDRNKLGRAVLALWPLRVIGAIRLDDLSVINIRLRRLIPRLQHKPAAHRWKAGRDS